MAASQEEQTRNARAIWPGIVARIRRGEPRAAADFARLCRPGIGLLLKLNLSAVGLDRIVEETIAGAVEEVRRGWIREPRDLSAFVRTVIARLAPESARRGAGDQARARQRAADIEAAFHAFPAEQRIWLERFYIDGWEVADIVAASGMSIQEFSDMRRRLRIEAGLMETARPWPHPKVRGAAAGEYA